MKKIVHIHTDLKFLNETERFNKFFFSNTVIIIGVNISYKEVFSFQPIILSNRKEDIRRIVTICSSADVVVLYELDSIKSYIAMKIPQNIAIAWRFFGAELYDKNAANYLSDNSLKFFKTKKEKLSKIFNYKALYGKIVSEFMDRTYPGNYFADAMKRIDLFLCLSRYEYDHLAQYWKDLAPFVQIPFNYNLAKLNVSNKKDLVLIGNSRGIYNNQIDVIQLIENSYNENKITFLLPFSYGMENYYTKEIRRLVRNSNKNFVLLEKFMPYESYFNIVGGAKAAVFNSYRQLAMGNIYESIFAGIKIYLSTHNVIYRWFKDLGLKIFTIEDFASDLESSNLELCSEDKESNIHILNQFPTHFSEDQFIIDINSAIETEDTHT